MKFAGSRSLRAMAVTGIVTAFAAAPAIAAVEFICHPDPAGTRAVSVAGEVQGYELRNGTVTVALRGKGDCTRLLRWRALQGGKLERLSSCASRPAATGPGVGRSDDGGRVATVGADGTVTITRQGRAVAIVIPRPASEDELIALRGNVLAVLTRGTRPDSPAELTLYSVKTAQPISRWPVPYEPLTLDIYRGTAVFSEADHGGVYALRLRDGRIGFVGANRRSDMPQIDRQGVVYEDDLYKRDARNGRVLFKYVPAPAVANEIQAAGRPVTLAGPLKAFAMDGPRVAAAYRNRQNGCDRIVFWNVPWNYLAPVTRMPEAGEEDEADEYPTCAGVGLRPHVAALALGGIQATWILSGRDRRLVTSTSAACVEHIVGADAGQVRALAGDGEVLAYGTQDGRMGVITKDRVPRARALIAGAAGITGLSADRGRIAVLRQNGAVEVRTINGEHLISLKAHEARAIALRADTLLVLTTADTLEVFDAGTALLRSTWHVPRGVRSDVDAHFGVAVLTRDRQIFTVNLASGRTTLIATAPRPARAQIEAPGIAYGYNLGGHGVLRFIPLTLIERRTS